MDLMGIMTTAGQDPLLLHALSYMAFMILKDPAIHMNIDSNLETRLYKMNFCENLLDYLKGDSYSKMIRDVKKYDTNPTNIDDPENDENI